MKIKIREFKGLFTNSDGNDLPLEYLKKAENVTLKNKHIDSASYTTQRTKYSDTLWRDIVYLSDDKLGNILEGYKLHSSYKGIYKKCALIIEDGHNKVIFKLDNNIIGEIAGDSITIQRVYNYNGVVEINTSKGIYQIKRINRFRKYLSSVEDNYYLIKKYDTFNINPILKSYSGNSTLFNDYEVKYENDYKYVDDHYEVITDRNGDDITLPGFVGYRLPLRNMQTGANIPPWFYYQDESFVYPLADENTHFFFEGEDYIFVYVGVENGKLISKDFTGVTRLLLSGYDGTTTTNPEVYIFSPEGGKRLEQLSGSFQCFKKAWFLDLWKFNLVHRDKVVVDVKNNGFKDTEFPYLKILTTVITDNKEEVISNENIFKPDISSAGTDREYVIGCTISVDDFINISKDKTITGIAFYLKKKENEEYEQLKVLNFLGDTYANSFGAEYNFYIDKLTPNGIFLPQTIGAKYDNNYKYLKDYDELLYVGKVPYARKGDLVYGCSIANGQLQELFYDKNIIPEISNHKLIYLFELSDSLGVQTEKEIVVLTAQDDREGGIIYYVSNRLSMLTTNKNQVVQTPEGVLLLTKGGVYATNGQQRTLLSYEINDQIENISANGILSYNYYKEKLFILADNVLYVYDFLNKGWTTSNVSVISSNARFVVDAEKIYLHSRDDEFYFLYEIIEKESEGKVETHLTDFGEPSLHKAINYIRADFEGIIKYNGITENSVNRSVKTLNIPLHKRAPSIKKNLEFAIKGKLYGIELDLEIIGEVRS